MKGCYVQKLSRNYFVLLFILSLIVIHQPTDRNRKLAVQYKKFRENYKYCLSSLRASPPEVFGKNARED